MKFQIIMLLLSLAFFTTALNSGNECVTTPCTGEMTYFSAGLGACGIETNGGITSGVALSNVFFGSPAGTGNAYCGLTVAITYGGVTVDAEVIDVCYECGDLGIDTTFATWGELGIPLSDGEVEVTWQIIN